MSSQTPSAVFPVAPPVAGLAIIDTRTGRFTPTGLNLFTQLWAGLQGKGGVKQDTSTLFNMSGDATIDSDGVLTISDDAITTQKIADDAVATAKVADHAITLAKLAQLVATSLLGNSAGAPADVAAIAVGTGLLLAAGVLSALTPGQTVASLPTGQDGERRMVNDAAAPAFGSPVVGGGAVVVPVYWDTAGAAWNVG